MEITTSIDGNKAIVWMKGKLTVETSPKLNEAIDALPVDVCDFDIDLANVSYVASAGLRELVVIDKLAVKRGGKMRLLNPTPEVAQVLDVTSLSDVFCIVC